MKKLLAWIGLTLLQAGACVGMCVLVLFIFGKSNLVMPFSIGVGVGTVYWLYFGYRFFFADELDIRDVSKTLNLSIMVRWMLLLGVGVIAGSSSDDDLFGGLAGLLAVFALMMINLIVYACRSNANKKS